MGSVDGEEEGEKEGEGDGSGRHIYPATSQGALLHRWMLSRLLPDGCDGALLRLSACCLLRSSREARRKQRWEKLGYGYGQAACLMIPVSLTSPIPSAVHHEGDPVVPLATATGLNDSDGIHRPGTTLDNLHLRGSPVACRVAVTLGARGRVLSG